MKELFEYSNKLIETVSIKFVRDQISILDYPDRLIGIKGSRGVGKTTLLLQYIKINLVNENVIYLSLDDLYFAENSLVDFVDDFVKNGGKYLFIDEVHHYRSWSIELKNIYDRYPELKIVFTGSSILKLSESRADLSRRAVIFTLRGLSLREFVNINHGTDIHKFNFAEILSNHQEISGKIRATIKPIREFNEYINFGYYPFFLENVETYHIKLKEILNLILESDIPYVTEMEFGNVDKLRKLLYIISQSVPFKPNILKLSERIGLSRNTLKHYLFYLNKAEVTGSLYSDKKGISLLTKPEKIYLFHPNLMFALSPGKINVGTIRETFFLNQVSFVQKLFYPQSGDFITDGKHLFEVGGKNKTEHQIKGISKAYLAIDGIETGYKNHIPLWLFGFLY